MYKPNRNWYIYSNNIKSSLSNSYIFVSAKNCQHKSKIIKLTLATVWNTLAIKIANINLGYDGRIVDHIGNSTFLLKLVRRGFLIQKRDLRPISFPVVYFVLWEKYVSFFSNDMIAKTYWFQYEWKARDLSKQFWCLVGDTQKTQSSNWVFKFNLHKILF